MRSGDEPPTVVRPTWYLHSGGRRQKEKSGASECSENRRIQNPQESEPQSPPVPSTVTASQRSEPVIKPLAQWLRSDIHFCMHRVTFGGGKEAFLSIWIRKHNSEAYLEEHLHTQQCWAADAGRAEVDAWLAESESQSGPRQPGPAWPAPPRQGNRCQVQGELWGAPWRRVRTPQSTWSPRPR